MDDDGMVVVRRGWEEYAPQDRERRLVEETRMASVATYEICHGDYSSVFEAPRVRVALRARSRHQLFV